MESEINTSGEYQNSDVLHVRQLSRDAGRVVFVSGNFNVVHPGHLRLLKFAADVGDFLVVGITPDGSPNVTVPAVMRLEALQAISIVDCAVRLAEPAESFISRLQPQIVVKGREHESQYNPEHAVLAAYGGKLLFSSGEVKFSSLDLLHHEYAYSSHNSAIKAFDYLQRHEFDLGDLRRVLHQLQGLRTLVIGDLILDEYISCDPLGMSQEDPTIVVTPIESKTFVGGAGIVAGHANGLGGSVRFVTLAGDDERADFAREKLAAQGVEVLAFTDDTRPTPLKQRYRTMGKTLLRVNHLRQHAAAPALAAQMMAAVEAMLDTTDLVLFADFNYGCLPQTVVDGITAEAKRRGVMIAADSQASSQMSDISRYRGARLLTPTEREARLALQDSDSGLVVVAEKLQRKTGAENVVVTLGSEGLLLHAHEGARFRTDQLPALNTSPRDVAGAGDSLFASTAMALCTGADIWRSTYLGSLAAACQVSRVGNTPLTPQDMLAEIDGQRDAPTA
jgi:rfaE bifunctional protein kinase chain/domain